MGLIIKDKIQALLTGYPTVSDKYNVQGGILEGTKAANFGDLLLLTDTDGAYKLPTEQFTVDKIAGILLATNIKTPHVYPSNSALVQTYPGEALNLMLNGYVAIELDAEATVANVKPGAKVAVMVNVASKFGKFTTADKADPTTIVVVPGWEFTGVIENHGTNDVPVYVAEIVMKCC